MSHFVGLIITTPDCDLAVDEALDKYWEENDVPEYRAEEVRDIEKIRFLLYFSKKYNAKLIAKEWVEKTGIKLGENEEAISHTYDEPDSYVKFVKENYPNVLRNFSKKYEKHGKKWNGGDWRKEGRKWYRFSTYNPDSKWDWWTVGGRWDCCLKTKDNEYVNECLLGEIDWTPFSESDYDKEKVDDFTGKTYRPLKDDVRWHLTEDKPPFCVIINGEWHEKGEMGWWGMTHNEKEDTCWEDEFKNLIKELPEDSEVIVADFHI